VPLNDASRRSARQRTIDEVLAELTSENPRERVGAFRQWLKVSLSLVHLHVLTVLESDGPLSMSHLAEALDVSVASATGIVDRMEQRGLVERRREEDDRRVVLVHPTDAGDSVFRTIAEQRRQLLIPVLGRMTDEELESFLIGLRAMRRVRAEAMAAQHAHAKEAKSSR
jgi:DNA-binding MarR family transcriptional regulator